MAAVRHAEAFSDCFLPYRQCSKLCRECNSKVREEVERFALAIWSHLPAKFEGEPKEYWASIARDEYLEAMNAQSIVGGTGLHAVEQVRAFCLVVHLDEVMLRRVAGYKR
jgi:hypothetical protein